MRVLAGTLLIALVSCASSKTVSGTIGNTADAIQQQSIYVLGTIHGNMLEQPQNSVRHFVTALYSFGPTLIVTEVRPQFPGAIEGAIDGGPEQALVYAFAKQNNIHVIPADWFDDQYNTTAE